MILLRGPMDAKTRKDCQKAMMALRRAVFALAIQIRAQARIIPRTKVRESPKKGKSKEEAHPQSGLSPLKHLKKKDIAMPGNLMTGLPVSRLMILGLQLQDSIAREIILLGWRYPL